MDVYEAPTMCPYEQDRCASPGVSTVFSWVLRYPHAPSPSEQPCLLRLAGGGVVLRGQSVLITMGAQCPAGPAVCLPGVEKERRVCLWPGSGSWAVNARAGRQRWPFSLPSVEGLDPAWTEGSDSP